MAINCNNIIYQGQQVQKVMDRGLEVWTNGPSYTLMDWISPDTTDAYIIIFSTLFSPSNEDVSKRWFYPTNTRLEIEIDVAQFDGGYAGNVYWGEGVTRGTAYGGLYWSRFLSYLYPNFFNVESTSTAFNITREQQGAVYQTDLKFVMFPASPTQITHQALANGEVVQEDTLTWDTSSYQGESLGTSSVIGLCNYVDPPPRYKSYKVHHIPSNTTFDFRPAMLADGTGCVVDVNTDTIYLPTVGTFSVGLNTNLAALMSSQTILNENGLTSTNNIDENEESLNSIGIKL